MCVGGQDDDGSRVCWMNKFIILYYRYISLNPIVESGVLERVLPA